MLTLEQYIKERDCLNKLTSELGIALKQYQQTIGGLISENARTTKQYQNDKNSFNAEFSKLRKLNKVYTKIYKTELRKIRFEKRMK